MWSKKILTTSKPQVITKRTPFLTKDLQFASFVSRAPTFFSKSPTIERADMRVDEDEELEVLKMKIEKKIKNNDKNLIKILNRGR